MDGKAWRHDILRTLRMVYRFGIENHLADTNPARVVRTHQPVRSERMLPLTIAEVDGVAEESGKWGPLVVHRTDADVSWRRWTTISIGAATTGRDGAGDLLGRRQRRGRTGTKG